MNTYKVRAISVMGKNSVIFKSGSIVTANDFTPNRVNDLVEKKFIYPIDNLNVDFKTDHKQNNPIRIAVITSMWKRHGIFEAFAKNINDIISQFTDVEIKVFVAGSESNISQSICRKHGFTYSEVKNNPLGKKMNTALKSSRDFNPDYFLLLGSDDIFCSQLMKEYIQSIRLNIDYTYLEDCYFYDTVSRKTLYWGGYTGWRKGKGLGAGRFISRNVVNCLNWNIWADGNNKNLDYSFDQRLSMMPCTRRKINLKSINAYMVDLKSSESITKFFKYPNSKEINSSQIFKQFNYVRSL